MADADVDRQIIERLRAEGHEVKAIAEQGTGTPDHVVLATANVEGALLLTRDKDFGELVVRRQRVSTGVVLIRLDELKSVRKAAIVSAALEDYNDDLFGAFTVIEPGNVRIRRLDSL